MLDFYTFQEKLEFLPAVVSFVKHCGDDILGVQSTKTRYRKPRIVITTC